MRLEVVRPPADGPTIDQLLMGQNVGRPPVDQELRVRLIDRTRGVVMERGGEQAHGRAREDEATTLVEYDEVRPRLIEGHLIGHPLRASFEPETF